MGPSSSTRPRADPRPRAGPARARDWSIAELVAHLLDSDLVLGDRMKRVIAEDEPTLLAFDETAWIERLARSEMPVEEAVNLFAAHRHWMTRVLRSCAEADFARAGHTPSGPHDARRAGRRLVSHLDHHLRFLYGKRATLGVASSPATAT